jgi:hypothetical protein
LYARLSASSNSLVERHHGGSSGHDREERLQPRHVVALDEGPEEESRDKGDSGEDRQHERVDAVRDPVVLGRDDERVAVREADVEGFPRRVGSSDDLESRPGAQEQQQHEDRRAGEPEEDRAPHRAQASRPSIASTSSLERKGTPRTRL